MNNFILVLKKMFYILNRPQKILCIFVFLMICFSSVLECLGVSVIIPIVNVILSPEILMKSELVQTVSILRDLEYDSFVIVIIGSVIAIYFFKNFFFIAVSWVRIKFSNKIQREISIRMMESYMCRGYQFFLQKDFGELNRGVSGDTIAVYTVLNSGFKFLSDVLTIILICSFMFFTDWSLSFMMVVMSLLCITLIYSVFRRNMYKAGIRYREFSAGSYQAIVESFQGIKDILILRRQRYFVDTYEKNQIGLNSAQCKQVIGQESPAYIIEGLCVSGLLAVVAIRIVSGERSAEFIATLAAFAIGAFRILPALGRISISLNQILTNIPSINAVYDNIIETEQYAKLHPEMKFSSFESAKLIAGRKNGVKKNHIKQTNELELSKNKIHFQNTLALKDVSFCYYNNAENIFEQLNLEVRKGQSIALIGSSGAGKSTLVDILLGLLVPQKGKIMMDGTNITEIPDVWARLVGYVPQSVFLSSDSIKKNVAFGENGIDEKAVREALQRADLLEFIDTLPQGIHTKVGDRGIRLSGGQRQRIAIARALYHKPEIMVLDEATSALDNETESAIMSAIDALQGQVTLIIVAHRLTTIRNCDVIYEVVDKSVKVRDKKMVLRGI